MLSIFSIKEYIEEVDKAILYLQELDKAIISLASRVVVESGTC